MAKQATYDLGYEITQEGDTRVVSFRGDGMSWAGYFTFPIFFLCMAPLFATSFWLVPLAIMGASGFGVYRMFQRQDFVLTPTGIVKGGVDYDQSKISEVLIDNPLDKEIMITGQPTLIFGGSGVAGASMAAFGTMANATASAALGANMAIRRSAAKRRFRVRIRYGKTVVTVARNLNQDHAISIFDLLTAK